MITTEKTTEITAKKIAHKTIYPVLFMICFSHLLNDLMQSVIPSIYPLIKEKYDFSFTQIGIITFTYQVTASLLQPWIGRYTDKKPQPYSLPLGMLFSLSGIILLAFANNFYLFLFAVALVGLGSSIFHPESSRVAYIASGGQKGLAQSIFQLGGSFGTALGPLLAAIIIIPFGQTSLVFLCLAAFLGIFILQRVSKWYQEHLDFRKKSASNVQQIYAAGITKKQVMFSMAILFLLLFSKYIYMASMTNYFTFYLIDKFHVSVQHAQYYLFAFLAAVAVGTMIGGPVGDRIGRKYVIWFSILGVAPFTLLLPHLSLLWTIVFAILIGLILSSAFSAIMLYATDLVPGKIGTIAGLFYGLMFGVAGIASAGLGWIMDRTSVEYVFSFCAYLPLIGIFAVFLPKIKNPASEQ
ncbi:MFS transporter [Soonwooa sp.]|uniref:MFS transporter n=1 Tax=Soonwooa sp. TaxID=1938592 RepID=UPI00260D9BEA|nr:MFS transporter [Soonwooa sp.]